MLCLKHASILVRFIKTGAPPRCHAKQKQRTNPQGVIISVFITKWKVEKPHTEVLITSQALLEVWLHTAYVNQNPLITPALLWHTYSLHCVTHTCPHRWIRTYNRTQACVHPWRHGQSFSPAGWWPMPFDSGRERLQRNSGNRNVTAVTLLDWTCWVWRSDWVCMRERERERERERAREREREREREVSSPSKWGREVTQSELRMPLVRGKQGRNDQKKWIPLEGPQQGGLSLLLRTWSSVQWADNQPGVY